MSLATNRIARVNPTTLGICHNSTISSLIAPSSVFFSSQWSWGSKSLVFFPFTVVFVNNFNNFAFLFVLSSPPEDAYDEEEMEDIF